MNSALLSILELIQEKESCTNRITTWHLITDWSSLTRDYFFNLPNALVLSNGLEKSEKCYRAIESLDIPVEWLATEADKLSQFEFNY